MKPGAVLVNTSRGPIVVEPDLIEALKQRKTPRRARRLRPRAACPPTTRCASWSNVTLSPHLGYVHEDNYRIFYGDTVENVAAWIAGKPLRVINA